MSSHKNIIIGYYLKVSKLFETKTYNSKVCKVCNKEYTKSVDNFCNLHGDTLESKSETFKEVVNLENYNDEFISFCKNKNYNLKKTNLYDIVAVVRDSDTHEFLISNSHTPLISTNITHLDGESGFPEVLGKPAFEYFEPIINFLNLKNHKVELKLGILTYWD